MWNAMARQKNSYLHATVGCKNVDPVVLNKCVDMAMVKKEQDRKSQECNKQREEKSGSYRKNEPGTCRKDTKQQQKLFHAIELDKLDNFCHPGYCHPTLREPDSFGVKVFRKDARIAYGLAGLPKLIREMNSENPDIQSKALHSLANELKDPYKCLRAITDFQIGKKLNEAMDTFYPYVPDDPSALENLVLIIGIVALHYEGASQILDEHQLVSCLYDMIIDDRCVSKSAAKVLKIMSAQPHIADLMASGDHLRRVIHVLNRVEMIEDVYLELANLIERSPGKALDEECFTYLYSRLQCRDEFQAYVMKCFALLINSNEAQQKCDEVDIVNMLYEMLADDAYPLMTLEYTALAMASALHSTPAMWRCREFWNLPLILIKRAHTKNSPSLQLWSLQALRQLTAMTSVKNFVRKSCKKRIKSICCLSPAAEKIKEKLLQWTRYKPYAPEESDDDYDEESKHFEPDEEKPIETELYSKRYAEGEREGSIDQEKELKAMKNEMDDILCHPPDIAYRLDYYPVKKTETLSDVKVKASKKSFNSPRRTVLSGRSNV